MNFLHINYHTKHSQKRINSPLSWLQNKSPDVEDTLHARMLVKLTNWYGYKWRFILGFNIGFCEEHWVYPNDSIILESFASCGLLCCFPIDCPFLNKLDENPYAGLVIKNSNPVYGTCNFWDRFFPHLGCREFRHHQGQRICTKLLAAGLLKSANKFIIYWNDKQIQLFFKRSTVSWL